MCVQHWTCKHAEQTKTSKHTHTPQSFQPNTIEMYLNPTKKMLHSCLHHFHHCLGSFNFTICSFYFSLSLSPFIFFNCNIILFLWLCVVMWCVDCLTLIFFILLHFSRPIVFSMGIFFWLDFTSVMWPFWHWILANYNIVEREIFGAKFYHWWLVRLFDIFIAWNELLFYHWNYSNI